MKLPFPLLLVLIGAGLILIGFLLYNRFPQLATALGTVSAALVIGIAAVFFSVMIYQMVFKKKK